MNRLESFYDGTKESGCTFLRKDRKDNVPKYNVPDVTAQRHRKTVTQRRHFTALRRTRAIKTCDLVTTRRLC